MNSLVNALGDVFAEIRVQQGSKGRSEFVRREDQQGHGALEVVEEFGVRGGARGEVGGCEVEGWGDVGGGVGGGGAGADKLDELEAEEGEVEGGVLVEDLWVSELVGVWGVLSGARRGSRG